MALICLMMKILCAQGDRMRELGRNGGGLWVGWRRWGLCSPALHQCNHDRRSPLSQQCSQTLLTFFFPASNTHHLSFGADTHTHTHFALLSQSLALPHLPTIQSLFCIRSDALHFRYSSCVFSISSSPVQCLQSRASCYAPARTQSERR